MHYLFRLKEYFAYLANRKGKHRIHSPFVFEFIERVLRDRRYFYCYDEIEHLRDQLLAMKDEIEVIDFGAGPSSPSGKWRSIRFITRTSSKSKAFARLLFLLADHYKCSTILEMGTSFGISALYFSSVSQQVTVTTLEGSPAIAALAQKNFDALNRRNIILIEGEFNSTLNDAIRTLIKIDLAFIDGNHRMQPTLAYFETLLAASHNETIFVFDDIYWSPEMKMAWQKIKADRRITLTIDLFHLGIAFLKKELSKENFVLKF